MASYKETPQASPGRQRLGLSNPSSLSPTATVTSTTTYTLSATVRSGNLVTNGDFEGGPAGFSTDYALGTTSCFGLGFLDCEGTFGVLSNPMDGHQDFSACSDVVGGSGMMVVNGAAAFQNVWCQTINVNPNTNYDFSAWVTSVHPSAPAILQFSINGGTIGPVFNAGAPCAWGQFSTSWNSGGNTSATICILNQNTAAGGNDFALDGISFSEICEAMDDVTIYVVDLIPDIAPPGEIDCNDPNSCIFLDGSSSFTNGNNLSYEWTASAGGVIQSGARTATPLVCSSGTYTLTVTAELNGMICMESLSVNVFDNMAAPPDPSILGPEVVCGDSTFTYTILNDPSYTNYEWQLMSGGTIQFGQGTNEVRVNWDNPDNVELCLLVSNDCNQTGYNCITISLVDTLAIPDLDGPEIICEGDSLQTYWVSNPDSMATSMTWSVGSGIAIDSGQGMDTVYINWGTSGGGELCLQLNGICDTIETCMMVTVDQPPANIQIQGPALICEGQTDTMLYTLSPTAGVDTFLWTVPMGGTIIDGQNTDSLRLRWDSGSGGMLCVGAGNECGEENACYNITIAPSLNSSFDTLLCGSNTFLYNGTLYGNGNVSGQEIFTSQAGCDSIVTVTINPGLPDTMEVDLTSCDPNNIGTTQILLMNASGCDSLVITTTTLLTSDTTEVDLTSCDPNAVGTTQVLLMNSNNCDSLVITTTTLLASDTTEVDLTSCDPNAVGTTQVLLMNSNNCDSLVITTTTLLASDTTEVDLTSCDPNAVGITQVLLMNSNNCDSLVITTTTLLTSDTTEVDLTSCDPNAVGTTQVLLMNSNSCDSLVITTTSFLASDTTEVNLTSCDPNAVGTTQLLLMNSDNCDSLVITTTSFLASDTTEVNLTSCDPNAVGTTQLLLMNSNSCDSLVITTTSFLASDTTEVNLTSCDPNAVGTTQLLLMNSNSCDSLVITTTSFLASDTTEVNLTSCDPNAVGTTQLLLMNSNSCDSLVITTTSLLASDTTEVNLTSCDPNAVGTTQLLLMNSNSCDSLVITTTSFLASDTTEVNLTSCDPNAVGTTQLLLMNSNSCDSLVITTTSFLANDTTEVNLTSCDPNAVGTTQLLLMNSNSCDSLVITTTSFLASDTTEVNLTSCDPNAVGTTQLLLMNSDNCDSLVITMTSFLASDTTEVNLTSCDPNAVGTTSFILPNQNGCDSLVITMTALLPSDTTEVFETSCDPSMVGTTSFILPNQNGCDSLVITMTALLPGDTTEIFETSCDPSMVGTTSSILPNQNGCDSLVITMTALLPSDTTEIFETSCDPSMVGTTSFILPNQNGCDSLVIIMTALLPSDTTEVFGTSCDPSMVGTTSFVLPNQNGCDSLILVMTVLLPPDSCGVEAFVITDTIGCNEDMGTLQLITTLGQAPFNYQWEGPGTNPLGQGNIAGLNQPTLINGLLAGDYSITVTSASGFQQILTATIQQDSSVVIGTQLLSDYNGANLSCANAADGIAAATILSGGTGPFDFIWSDGQQGEEAVNLGSGWHSVTLTDAEGCQAVDSVFLAAPEPLQVISAALEIDCVGDADGEISLAGTEGGTPPYQYSLNNSPFQISSEFFNLTSGSYSFDVVDANGCQTSGQEVIQTPVPIFIALGADMSIQLGDSIRIQAVTNITPASIDSVVWTNTICNGCLEVIVRPVVTTTYSVSVIDENGCPAEDEVIIEVLNDENVFIPNVFTPNGDGINDRFLIFADDGVKQVNSFQIYSRWGEKVFSAINFQPNDADFGWDGIYKGEPLNPAVFGYWALIEFEDGRIVLFEGDVTLAK